MTLGKDSFESLMYVQSLADDFSFVLLFPFHTTYIHNIKATVECSLQLRDETSALSRTPGAEKGAEDKVRLSQMIGGFLVVDRSNVVIVLSQHTHRSEAVFQGAVAARWLQAIQ